MSRRTLPVLLAIVVIFGVIGWATPRSWAQTETPGPSPTVTLVPECSADWATADVRPFDARDAAVIPAGPAATPAAGEPVRELYLVVINLPPGGCMPYDAPGNQKDGAVVLMVQQGKVIYTWRKADPAATPSVIRGDLTGHHIDISGHPLEPQTLYPGDWVTQNQQVRITYRNVGGDSAIILKAVYAVPSGGGCGGGCH